MANQIVLKKSSVIDAQGVPKAPLPSDLIYGELAINYAAGKLYYKTASNTIAEFVSSGSEGLDVDQTKSLTKVLTLTTDWQDVGISGADLATGTYIVQLYANDSGAGGYNSNEYYSGTMSWYSGSTFTSAELPSDEIPLHRAGASSDAGLYLRTYRTNNGVLKLQVYSNYANASSSNYVFKFRRLI